MPYKNIRNAINQHFKFLQDQYHFSSFVEEQIAYEYHFTSKKENLEFDIWFELAPSSPVWLWLNGHYIEILEPENAIVVNYNPTSNEANLIEYLAEMSAIVKRNPQILEGDFSAFLIKKESQKSETKGYLLIDGEMEIDFEELAALQRWIEDNNIKNYGIFDADNKEIKKQ